MYLNTCISRCPGESFFAFVECGALPEEYAHYTLAEDGLSFRGDACVGGNNILECANGTWIYNESNCGKLSMIYVSFSY